MIRRALLVVLSSSAAAALSSCGDAPAAPSGGRSVMLLEPRRVELLEGFDDAPELRVWNDHLGRNPDRDELAIQVRRESRLRWTVAGGGTLRTGFARWQLGPTGDATPALATLEVRAANGTLFDRTEFGLRDLPADPGATAATEREGPTSVLTTGLPDGEWSVDFVVRSPEGAPEGAYVSLLAPWVERDVPVVDSPLRPEGFDESQWLTARLGGDVGEVAFGERLTGSIDAPTVEAVSVPRLEDAGSFNLRHGRHALALAGDATFTCEVELGPGAALRGALALDERMPAGARGTLAVTLDGAEVARLPLTSPVWTPIEVPLVGTGRATLALRLVPEPFEPALVVRDEPDFVIGGNVPVGWKAGVLRAGLAQARVDVPRALARRAASRARPSVLVVHCETLRADVLAPYGGDPAVTPNLAALANVSTVYEHAIAPSPWTLPSTATLFTGLPPSAHGVVDHDKAVLPDALATLAERARAAGVTTGAVVTNDLLRPDAGYARGFDTYAFVPYANARQVAHLAEAFLLENRGRQTLTVLHLWDPHHPFNAPGAWRDRFVEPGLLGLDMHAATVRIKDRLLAADPVAPDEDDVRFLRQRYLGDVAYLDHRLGELFAFLDAHGLADDLAVVVTADHGEEFLEHGLLGHGSQLFDETVRVPLVVAPPGALVGWSSGRPEAPTAGAKVVGRVASTAGLHAEILELLGVEARDGERPAALVPATSRVLGSAFTETDKGLALGLGGDVLRRPLRGLRTDDALLVERLALGDEERTTVCFYDLSSDPEAHVPLPADGPRAEALVAELRKRLEWAELHKVRAPTAGADVDQHGALGQLGYLGEAGSAGSVPECDGN